MRKGKEEKDGRKRVTEKLDEKNTKAAENHTHTKESRDELGRHLVKGETSYC